MKGIITTIDDTVFTTLDVDPTNSVFTRLTYSNCKITSFLGMYYTIKYYDHIISSKRILRLYPKGIKGVIKLKHK